MAVQRFYKPLLDALELTYPQYLVLNVLWREDKQTLGGIADRLALESSTLTPLLKRLEAGGLVRRARNLENERQVGVALTDAGRDLRSRAGRLADALLSASGQEAAHLDEMASNLRKLRDDLYAYTGDWNLTN